jgi:hypothetical protein
MTDPTTLNRLADECEGAEGPSRELFERAFVACYGQADQGMLPAIAAAWVDLWRRFDILIEAGAFVDAAMTLVPKGWTYALECSGNADEYSVDLYAPPEWERLGESRQAISLSLALTAASLRARAMEANHGGK